MGNPQLLDPETAAKTHDSLAAYTIEGTYIVSGLENESATRIKTTTIVRPGTGKMYEESVNESEIRTIRVSNKTSWRVCTEGEQTVTRFSAWESPRDAAVINKDTTAYPRL